MRELEAYHKCRSTNPSSRRASSMSLQDHLPPRLLVGHKRCRRSFCRLCRSSFSDDKSAHCSKLLGMVRGGDHPGNSQIHLGTAKGSEGEEEGWKEEGHELHDWIFKIVDGECCMEDWSPDAKLVYRVLSRGSGLSWWLDIGLLCFLNPSLASCFCKHDHILALTVINLLKKAIVNFDAVGSLGCIIVSIADMA